MEHRMAQDHGKQFRKIKHAVHLCPKYISLNRIGEVFLNQIIIDNNDNTNSHVSTLWKLRTTFIPNTYKYLHVTPPSTAFCSQSKIECANLVKFIILLQLAL